MKLTKEQLQKHREYITLHFGGGTSHIHIDKKNDSVKEILEVKKS
jgi:hypothetical protein